MRRALVLVLVAVLAVPGAAPAKLKDFRFMSKNISSTLDNLLAAGRYDKRIRPDMGGAPTIVTVSVYVKSMGSVSENEQKYAMDTYFRQSWFDSRLSFSLPGLDEFSMSWLFLDRVWKPDTFIVNGYRSYLHRITVPNKFLRVRKDGFITYSMRLTLEASCPMYLRKFPLDTQHCPLLIGSYGYTSKDVQYTWHPTGVGLEPGVELAQYDLVNITTTSDMTINRGRDRYSVITAVFHLQRNTGYYTLQVYVPCGLIVFCSWVSFWIDPDAVPARVSLAVTTVLSMTTLGFGGRSSMPRTNYATAMDWFVILCFAFVFAVLVEYAVINFIDKVTEDLRRLLEERAKKKKKKSSSVAGEPPAAPADEVQPAAASTPPASLQDPTSCGQEAEDQPTTSLGQEDEFPTDTLTPAEITADPLPVGSQRPSAEDEIVLADQESAEAAPDPSEPRPPDPSDTQEDCVIPIEVVNADPESTESTESTGGLLGAARESQSLRLRRCLTVPYRLWEQTRFLPNEEDVSKLMQSKEEPDKFTKIDIVSRKAFPIAYGLLIVLYWIMYGYYIADRSPEDEAKDILNELSHAKEKD